MKKITMYVPDDTMEITFALIRSHKGYININPGTCHVHYKKAEIHCDDNGEYISAEGNWKDDDD